MIERCFTFRILVWEGFITCLGMLLLSMSWLTPQTFKLFQVTHFMNHEFHWKPKSYKKQPQLYNRNVKNPIHKSIVVKSEWEREIKTAAFDGAFSTISLFCVKSSSSSSFGGFLLYIYICLNHPRGIKTAIEWLKSWKATTKSKWNISQNWKYEEINRLNPKHNKTK